MDVSLGRDFSQSGSVRAKVVSEETGLGFEHVLDAMPPHLCTTAEPI